MSWEYHDKCKESLESAYLLQFFQHGASVARASAAAAVEARDGGTCAQCVQLVATIMSWDFRGGHKGVWGVSAAGDNTPRFFRYDFSSYFFSC
jgi:hypothetical protein